MASTAFGYALSDNKISDSASYRLYDVAGETNVHQEYSYCGRYVNSSGVAYYGYETPNYACPSGVTDPKANGRCLRAWCYYYVGGTRYQGYYYIGYGSAGNYNPNNSQTQSYIRWPHPAVNDEYRYADGDKSGVFRPAYNYHYALVMAGEGNGPVSCGTNGNNYSDSKGGHYETQTSSPHWDFCMAPGTFGFKKK